MYPGPETHAGGVVECVASWDDDDLGYIGHSLSVCLGHGGLRPRPKPGHATVGRLRMAMRRAGLLRPSGPASQEVCGFSLEKTNHVGLLRNQSVVSVPTKGTKQPGCNSPHPNSKFHDVSRGPRDEIGLSKISKLKKPRYGTAWRCACQGLPGVCWCRYSVGLLKTSRAARAGRRGLPC
jgi:hypothetical protein